MPQYKILSLKIGKKIKMFFENHILNYIDLRTYIYIRVLF